MGVGHSVEVDNDICIDQTIWINMPQLQYVLHHNNRLLKIRDYRLSQRCSRFKYCEARRCDVAREIPDVSKGFDDSAFRNKQINKILLLCPEV
jgi:hypothetical protein